MVERTVGIKAHTYVVEGKDARGRKKAVRKIARRGDSISVTEEESERGDALGAFVDSPGREAPAPVETQEGLILNEAGVDELVAWLEEKKPNVKDTVEAANGDTEAARRILQAEDTATGGDPRKGVVDRLGAILNANQ